MIVASRCTEHGYGLVCSCGWVFNYIPSEKNYAVVNGSSRAICSECGRIWDESKKLIPSYDPIYMVVSVDLKDGDNTAIMALVGPSRLDIMAQADRPLKSIESQITGFHFQITDKEGYDKTLEMLKRRLASKMDDLFNAIFNQSLKEDKDG